MDALSNGFTGVAFKEDIYEQTAKLLNTEKVNNAQLKRKLESLEESYDKLLHDFDLEQKSNQSLRSDINKLKKEITDLKGDYDDKISKLKIKYDKEIADLKGMITTLQQKLGI